MPTIKQLPVATSVNATDLLPVSQGGTTKGLTVGGLLSSTQVAISLAPAKLLGRVSPTAGGPEPVNVGSGLSITTGVIAATAADHTQLPIASSVFAGDEVIVNSEGAAKRMPTTALRSLFSAGSGIGIDASGSISSVGPILPATAGAIGAVKPGAALAVGTDGTLDVQFGAGGAVAFNDPRIVEAEPLALGDLRRYGWVGDGRDESSVFVAALAALPAIGGAIVIPTSVAGTALGGITVNKPVTIRGEGGGPLGQTQIRPASLTTTIFTVTAQYVCIEDLGFGPAYPLSFKQTGGSYILVQPSAARFRAARLTMQEFHEGITIADTVHSIELTDVRGYLSSTGLSQSTALIHFLGGVDVRVDGVSAIGPGTGTADVLTGIWVENIGDGVITNVDIVAMGTNLLVSPASGQVVASLWVFDSFFDSADRGAYWAPSGTGAIVRSRMSNCWAGSNAHEGILVLAGVDGLDIDVPHVLLNRSDGISISGGSNVRVRGGQVAQNGGNGVLVAPGVSDWSIDGVTIGATGGLVGNAGFAIEVLSGASDRYRMCGNITAGNTAGAIQDAGTGAHKSVLGNLGDPDGYTAYRDGVTGYLKFVGRQPAFSGYVFATDDGVEHFRINAAGAQVSGSPVIHAGNIGSGLTWTGSALNVSAAGTAGPAGPPGAAGPAGPGPTNAQITSAIAPWFATLPTVLPSSAGQPWNDSGILAFS